MVPFPDELVQQIRFWCEANKVGLCQVTNPHNGLTLFLMGPQSMGPNEAALLAAHILIEGVITDKLTDADMDAIAKQDRESDLPPN